MGVTNEASSKPQTPVKQFDIMWADLPNPIGRRPVVLLTRSAAYAYLNKVVVAEVTSTIRHIPQEVTLGKPEGLRHPSVVNFDNIHVIPKTSLSEYVGAIPARRYSECKRALGYALDWPELKVL